MTKRPFIYADLLNLNAATTTTSGLLLASLALELRARLAAAE